MITVSSSFKDAMRAPVKVLKAAIYSSSQSGQLIVDSSTDLMSFTKEAEGYLLGTVIQKLTVTLSGIEWDLLNADILPQFAVQTAEGDWEYLSYGSFRVYEQQKDIERGITKLVCYDWMKLAADTPYRAGDITFPCTLADFVDQIVARFPFTLGTDITTLPNGNMEVSEDLYALINNTSYRDIIAEIAGATGTTAEIAEGSDTLKFILPSSAAVETLSNDNLLKLRLFPKYGPVNSVVLARTPQEDNIALTDEESIEANGLTELKIANNELLDDDREDLIQPLFNTLNGSWFFPFEATLEGHGWYECGDRLTIHQSEGDYEVIVTKIKVDITGGIKETIVGVAPDPTLTDYARAGGIMRTIYNTEIKVDKQNQEIVSIVERQDDFEGQTSNNFTLVEQNITNVITSVQNSGGANLIRNSAGYFKTSEGLPDVWQINIPSGSTIKVFESSEATRNGSLSHQVFELVGSTISQRIQVVPDNSSIPEDSKIYYTLSVRVKKGAVGSGAISLTNDAENHQLQFISGDSPFYDEYSIEALLPLQNFYDLTVTGSADSDFTVTDMMMAVGNFRTQWQQANGEFANTQVNIDINGVAVKSSTNTGNYTQQTPLGFQGFVNNQNTYGLDSAGVKGKTGNFTDTISMPPIKIVKMDNGWAFVPVEGSV